MNAAEIASKMADLHAVPGVAHAQLAGSFEAVARRCFDEGRKSIIEGAGKQMSIALGEAREMLCVFEDNGGHDGLGGKGYAATLDHIDTARAMYRELVTP